MKLILQQLSFERNFHFLFRELNITLSAGEILQIRGNNGSGKTTLLRILAGLLEPHEGKIIWQGQAINQHREKYQTQLHYLGHTHGIKSSLTVFENLQLSLALKQQSINYQKITTTLENFALIHLMETKAAHLSQGQLRKLSLARLALHPLPLWILDEPTTSLDKTGQEFFYQILQNHIAENGLAIIATHQDLNIPAKTFCLGELNNV